MDSAVELLKLIRDGSRGASVSGGTSGGGVPAGLRIVRAVTTDPSPITFVFEGTSLALDLAVFEVPIMFYPICKDDKFLSSPIIGGNTQRWGFTSRINRGFTIGTMLAPPTKCQVEGIGRPYDSANGELVLMPGLLPGDRVILFPFIEGGKIKYAITQKF